MSAEIINFQEYVAKTELAEALSELGGFYQQGLIDKETYETTCAVLMSNPYIAPTNDN